MSFDKFRLAVEPSDLSQADKSKKGVSSFLKLCDGSRTVNYTKKKLLGTWQFGKIYIWSILLFKDLHD